MLKLSLLVLSMVILLSAGAPCENGKDAHCMSHDSPTFDQNVDWSKAETVYQFNANDINGVNVPLKNYAGHVMIIVNVASKCGLTKKNYNQLVQLHEKYGDSKGLKILAFPSNQFLQQEPGTAQEILDFVKGYNVKFDMFEKIDVNGDNAHPLYKWLHSQPKGSETADIEWNFSKFIVDKDGKVVARYGPKVDPLSMEEDLNKYF